MWRLAYWTFSRVTGLSFRVQRRLSAAGLLALGTLIAAATLGIDTTQTLAYQVFALLAAVLAASLLATALLRQRFEATREIPRVITAGQPFEYRVVLANTGARELDGLALIEDAADPRPTYAEFRASAGLPIYRNWWRLLMRSQVAHLEEARVPALAAGARVEIRMRGFAYRRGTLSLEAISVARLDPLGLSRAFTRIAQPAKVTVLPKRYAVPPLALPGSRMYQPGGVSLASSAGESEEFTSLRDYRAGDPLQRIHWKSFARTGTPVVREYQDEFFERHALILDTFAAPRDAAAFEEAVSIAASFAATLDTRDCLLDLLFVGAASYCFTAGRGQLQGAQLLEILAGVRACSDRPFRTLAQAVLAKRSMLSGGILILLGWDEPRRAFADALRRQGVPLLALVVTDTELGAAPAWLRRLRPARIQEDLARI